MDDKKQEVYGLSKILIVDDHEVVVSGISNILKQRFKAQCCCATNVASALELLSNNVFDIIVLDLELKGESAFEIIKTVQTKYPNTKILIYSMHDEPWLLAKVIDYDIQGYLTKSEPVLNLVEAVSAIKSGHTYFCDSYTNFKKLKADNYELTPRECDVMYKVLEGLSSSEISEQLCLSVNTVNSHRKRIMQKLGVSNVVELLNVVAQKRIFDKK
jgi:two-component system response regulator EvgA